MVRSDEEQELLLRIAGLGEMLEDVRFGSPEARFENVAPIIDRLGASVLERTAREWLERFRAQGVSVSLVALTEEMSDDEQAKVNRVLVAPTDPAVGVPWVINHPVRLEGVEEVGPVRPPELGEHTDEILGELGLDAERIAGLRRDGAI